MLAAPLLALALSASAAQITPQKVTIGAYLNDIQHLELKSHSYAVDVYLWFRWKDPELDPATAVEFMNPNELWGHARTQAFPKPVKLPNGELYQVLRVQGRFSRKLPLNDYPFDRQALTVDIEDSSAGVDKLRYESGGLAVSPELSIPGFKIGDSTLTVSPFRYNTDFGDLRHKGETAYSRVRLSVPLSRPALTYSVKLLLPILSVIFCASLMFLFHPKHVDARVGIGITALLTIVALQITLNDDLPEVDYLVLMDKVYLGAYLFVIAGLAAVVKTTGIPDKESRRAILTERWILAALLGGYLASMAFLILPKL